MPGGDGVTEVGRGGRFRVGVVVAVDTDGGEKGNSIAMAEIVREEVDAANFGAVPCNAYKKSNSDLLECKAMVRKNA